MNKWDWSQHEFLELVCIDLVQLAAAMVAFALVGLPTIFLVLWFCAKFLLAHACP